jgi:hypothetical protein
VLEAEHREDEAAGLVRNQFPPIGRRGVAHRGSHDLEVLGAIGIGQDEEHIAAFLQVVLQFALPR